LTAVYLSGTGNEPAQELARVFPSHEIPKYRKVLQGFKQETLAKDTALGPEALTLEGLFLEQDGQRLKAKEAYLKAITPSSLKFDPGSRHPMQLPLIAPWNALGFLLKADKDPKIQAEAKVYFERGALEGDDPLSYYELAAFEPRTSEKWLRYTSKAAASGHEQAIINLTEFYQEVAKTESPLLEHGSVCKALNWLLRWRPGSAAAMAREWLQAASNMGHKPSMLQLAEYYESVGEDERAKDYLRQIVEPANKTNQREQWPQLVQLARKRLAGIR
jgi:TPR repeat protein